MKAYYNEIDPKCCAWLRQLINAGLITDGDVDERSITDVRPNDLRGYDRIHFFAGISGWDYALNLAGWPDDKPVWTGSPPCQPFSVAGKGRGIDDERHLWPALSNLIAECRPVRVFGEQTANAVGHGWLDLVRADLEAQDYSVGAAILGAHSVGAPHIRQRLYWTANAIWGQEQDQSCCRPTGRMGRQQQPISWNTPWQSALRELRALDDGLSYGVEGCNGPRNAIVPQVAAAFIRASVEAASEV